PDADRWVSTSSLSHLHARPHVDDLWRTGPRHAVRAARFGRRLARQTPGRGCQAGRPRPLPGWLALGERAQLAQPDPTEEAHAHIAPPQALPRAVGDPSLAHLGDVVLQPHQVDATGVQVPQPDFASQDAL